ncbi:uncharacterized protein LOC130646101 [Hydractinia symbiolongicarpus]|uniref:uncharacterized protein LOC130646101 n=1 Tax=Hydractinia symbiolongicarpus TaxID=13093 RepID=UPI00255084B7|nr:uncharacterized protein LOC130646101 [Hydractinia symbiolongicarpus]
MLSIPIAKLINLSFVTVDHEIILKKPYHYGIRGIPLSLLHSFLTNREQLIDIHNSLSSHKTIHHGVPQGSVLVPLLLLLYINDLHVAIKYSMNLTWKSQINNTISSLKKATEALAKIRHFVPKCVLIQILWCQKSFLTRQIEVLQNHADCMISFSTFNATLNPLTGTLAYLNSLI